MNWVKKINEHVFYEKNVCMFPKKTTKFTNAELEICQGKSN